MALVKEKQVLGGTIRIFDDLYRDIDAAEIARRHANVQRVISDSLYKRACCEAERIDAAEPAVAEN